MTHPCRSSKDPAVFRHRALALLAGKDLDGAIVNFTNAIALDPQDSLAYGGRGEAYVHKGDYQRAAADFTAAIEIDSSAPLTYCNRGVCRFALKKKDDRAIDDFSKAIALDPACNSAYFHRGLAWNSRNRHKQAIADFTEVIRLNPKHLEAYRNRAIAHAGRSTRCAEAEQAPEFKRALADLAAALRLAPKDPSLFITRARIWFREPWSKLPKHALDHAIDDFSKAIALGSHEPSNYTGRADARRWKVQNYINDPAAAIAEYTLAITELEGAASRFATNTLPRQTLTSLYLCARRCLPPCRRLRTSHRRSHRRHGISNQLPGRLPG